MIPFQRMSIHNKLAFALGGAVLLAFAVASIALALFGSLTLERRARQIMEPYAQLVSVGAEAAVAFEDPGRAREILATLRANPQILEAEIVLRDGRLLAGYSSRSNATFRPNRLKPDGVYLNDNTAELMQGLQEGAHLHLVMSLDELNRHTRNVLLVFAAGVLVLLVATTLGLRAALQRTIVRPISTLAETVEQVRSLADYHRRVPASGADEVARLGRSFNAMMGAIQERDNDLGRLTLFQRTLLDNVAYGIISASPDGIVSSFNRAAERLLGYTADEVVGKQTPACWHDPEEIARRALQLSEELGETIPPGFDVFVARPRRNQPEENEWTFIRKDGTRVPVLLSVTVLRDESGRITGFVGLTYDLTERKLAEELLHRLNRELRAISNCNQVLIRAEDEQTLLSEICRIICDEAGYRMAWVGYAENDDARTIRPVAWAGAEDGYLEQARFTWADTEWGRGPSGNAIRSGESSCIRDFTTDPQVAPWRESALQRGYRSSIALPLKDESANTFGILNIYSTEPNAFTPDEIRLLEELAGDLAFGIMVLRSRIERKQAEEALTHLAAIVESSDDAIIGKSLEGNILSWNRGAERLYGYREEEIKGRSVSILIPQDLAGELPKFLDNIKDAKPIEHYETSRLRKDGSRIEVSVTVSPICDSGGKVIGASTIARDITERRRAELELQKLNEELEQRVIERTTDLNKRSKELLESQQALMNIVEDLNEKTGELEQANSRLQELDRLKSMFIASMSHELRTPLNSVIGFSSVLLNEWVGPVNAEQKENLAIILRSGKHLLSLINDVIDVSKIEAGKIESVPEGFDLHDLVFEAVSLVKKELEEKGLVLRVTSPSQLMFTDRRRLLQCVLNLLSNAVKFTEQGGVTVATRIVQVSGEKPEAGVAEISVTDTGIGIREEEIGKMFQPFERLFSPLQSTVPGTGLGLYLTRKLTAEVLKGDILLTSEYGKGSRFTIKIPVRMP